MVKIVGEEWVRWAWGDLDHKTLFLLWFNYEQILSAFTSNVRFPVEKICVVFPMSMIAVYYCIRLQLLSHNVHIKQCLSCCLEEHSPGISHTVPLQRFPIAIHFTMHVPTRFRKLILPLSEVWLWRICL
jgi:hypothetical protein